MKIYLVERTDDVDYDQYDSLIVIASSIDGAKQVKKLSQDSWNDWTNSIEHLAVTEIGQADLRFEKPQVILGSFRAG